nr:uncharacterized protein LOC111105273 isoform X3 [Crassostrea virginica]
MVANTRKLVIFLLIQQTASSYCSKPVIKVRTVEVCPTSKEEWTSASLKMSCAAVALLQKCTNNFNYKYHCLINSYRNETVEVCTQRRIIFGRCPEFNDAGRLIQPQERSPCNETGFPKCNAVYFSTEAYRYQGCYKLVYERKKTSGKTENSTDTHEMESGFFILLPALVVFIFCVSIILPLVIYKLRKSKNVSGIISKRYKIMYRRILKMNTFSDYHLYLSLVEELKNGGHGSYNLEDIGRYVHDFRDDEGNSTLHIIIASDKSDLLASSTIDTLLLDGMSVDLTNTNNMTPLMLAVKQSIPRKKVIKTIMMYSPKLHCKDVKGSNVFHLCMGSCYDDETCADYLNIILKGKGAKAYLISRDTNKDTPLHIAAMETTYSRIHCIMLLLENGTRNMIKSTNEDWLSSLNLAVTSLKGKSTYVELECSVRVIVFLLYGDYPDTDSETNDNTIDECEYDSVKSILRNPRDLENMENILKSIFVKLNVCPSYNIDCSAVPPSSSKIRRSLMNCIAQSMQLLKNRRLDTIQD